MSAFEWRTCDCGKLAVMPNHDDGGASIQSAVEQLWSGAPYYADVAIPPGDWTINDTLHLTDPSTPTAITVGACVRGARPAMGVYNPAWTRLLAAFNDQPLISMQRARGCEISDIHLQGQNEIISGMDLYGDLLRDDVWLASGVTDDHVGIDIDSNPANTSGSSAIKIRDVSIDRVATGIAVGRNGTTLSAENLLFDNVILRETKSSYSFGQGQSKNNIIRGGGATFFQYFVDCLRSGSGLGWPPHVEYVNIGAGQRAFNLSAGFGTFTCIGLYSENLIAIGTLGAAANGGSPMTTFLGCEFGLVPPATRRAVDVHAYCFRPVEFKGCTFHWTSEEAPGNDLRFYVYRSLTFDHCSFEGTGHNGHLPVSFRSGQDANVEMRWCEARDEYANLRVHGRPASVDALIGNVTLSAVDGTNRATFTQPGHGLDVGDMVKLTGASAPVVKSDPVVYPYTFDGVIGIVTAIEGDDVTLQNVSEQVALPHAGALYRRRVTVA